MSISENSIENNALAALSKQAPLRITHAIQRASAKTGVDFAYLMEQASAESNFDAKATAKTSSATGLYQFIESTWINMVKQYGDRHGLGNYARHIGNNGKISDPAIKKEILELRKNPEKTALLAAEYAAENKRHLEQYVEGKIGSTELYLAHFMGASGATGFLNAKQENALSFGADLFPKEARANHNVFYNPQTGEPRTLTEIYDFFDKKFSGTPAEAPRIAAAEQNDYPLSLFFPMQHTGFTSPSLQDKSIMDFIMHPALEKLAPELFFNWKPQSFFLSSSTIMNPVELMMLAKRDSIYTEKK